MPHEHTQSEDDLQIRPDDLDVRIFDSFRSVESEKSFVPPPAEGDDTDAIIDSSDLFAAAPPRAPVPAVGRAAREPVIETRVEEEPVETEIEEPFIDSSPPRSNGGAWTIPLVCFGIGIISMALVVPAADDNRRLTWERERLARDLAHVDRQIAINDEFLARLATDPGLAERLAQRQMNMVREGTSVLDLGRVADASRSAAHDISPFELVTLPPPPPMPEYRPLGGKISALFHHPKSRLYLLGAGLLSLIVGVVLGSTRDEPQLAIGSPQPRV